MCKTKCSLIVALLCVLFSASVSAQNDVIRQQSCEDNSYRQSVDSLKQLYASEGYVLLREAAVSMESEYEMPIVLPMQAGTIYQFVFIGDPTSRLYEVRMFDWNERQVMYKKNHYPDR